MWKLMTDNAISEDEKQCLSEFVLTTSRFTQDRYVNEFEEAWSKWQGCKYSVFVNSGSSANLILVDALKQRYGNGLWISQTLTWSTNVSPIMQMGLPLQLCDISLDNLGPELSILEQLFQQTAPTCLFLTHLIGFCAITEELLRLCEKYNVVLVEDCCEAHGATFNGKKVGNFGVASSFSFYFGHHMTTIEGGMVCTDDEKLYHSLLLLRSHGLLRELPNNIREECIVEGIDPYFTFLMPGYNVRNTEMHALLGLLQLERLNGFIRSRNENLKFFLSRLDTERYRSGYNLNGVSSFCLPIWARNEPEKVKDCLRQLDMEFRPIISGNLYRHPMMEKVTQLRSDKNADIAHTNCVYVGNHPEIKRSQIEVLVNELNLL